MIRCRNLCYLLQGDNNTTDLKSLAQSGDQIAALILLAHCKHSLIPIESENIAPLEINNSEDALMFAERCFQEKRYHQAIDILSPVLDGPDYKESEDTLSLRGACYALVGKNTLAMRDYNRAIGMYKDADLLLQRGIVKYLIAANNPDSEGFYLAARFELNHADSLSDHPEAVLLLRVLRIQ